ncbi:MAG TPA: SMC-Scp complex subunit ScpB [Anaerolineae bacterium]|nr:SMC-Scp complex subunit ScpB [Anaerolineae bacterium]
MSESPVLTPTALLEALLFAAPQPVTIESLAMAAGMTVAETEAALTMLEEELAQRGVRLQRHKQRVQTVSAPEAAPAIEKLLGLSVNLRMSQAALETLAIIAYAQPVTRPQIESIRGVNSDGVLRTLLAAGLVEEVGRAETVGRPILYGTTFEFLQQFGLEKPDSLPPLQPPTGATPPAQ